MNHVSCRLERVVGLRGPRWGSLWGPLLLLFVMIPLTAGCASKEDKGRKGSETPSTKASEAAATKGEKLGEMKAATSDRPTMVFLGDSLTAGFGLSLEQAMPALIQSKVDEAGLGYQVINAGRSGDTTAGGLARLGWYLRQETRPQVLVIFLGANDGMRGLSTEEMGENLRKIIRAGREFDEKMQIFLVAVKAFPNMGPEFSERFEAVFPTVADEEKVPLIEFPLLRVAAKPELNQPDGIHPTVEGTQMVAEDLWNRLGSQLSPARP